MWIGETPQEEGQGGERCSLLNQHSGTISLSLPGDLFIGQTTSAVGRGEPSPGLVKLGREFKLQHKDKAVPIAGEDGTANLS